MFANSYNNLIFDELSVPFSTNELVDNLFIVIQNIVAGTADVSKRVVSNTCLQWKIGLSSSSAEIILQYELKCFENEIISMKPVTDYKLMDESSRTVDDTDTHKSIVTVDERKGNLSLLRNLKQEFPKLLSILYNVEKREDRSIEENQSKASSAELNIRIGSTLCGMKIVSDSVRSSSGRESSAVTAYERQSKKAKGIPNDIGINTNKGKAYSCSYCTKLFKRQCAKEEHERIHTVEKPCVSDKSKQNFNPSQNPMKQKQMNNVKNAPLTDCAYGTSKTHHERIHRSGRTFEHEISGKSLLRSLTSYELPCHQRIHTADKKPFKCDKSVTNSSHQSGHRKK